MIDYGDENYEFCPEIYDKTTALKMALLTCLLDKNNEVAKARFKVAFKSKPHKSSKEHEEWFYWLKMHIRDLHLLTEDFEYIYQLALDQPSATKVQINLFFSETFGIIYESGSIYSTWVDSGSFGSKWYVSQSIDPKWKSVMRDYYRLVLKITHIERLEANLPESEEPHGYARLTLDRLDNGMFLFIRTIREEGSLSGIAHLKGAVDLAHASLNKSNYPLTNEYGIKLLDFFGDVDSLAYGKSINPIRADEKPFTRLNMLADGYEKYPLSLKVNNKTMALKMALLTCLIDKSNETAKANFKAELNNRPPENTRERLDWSYWLKNNIYHLHLLSEDFEYVYQLMMDQPSATKTQINYFLGETLGICAIDSKWKVAMRDYYRLTLKIMHIKQIQEKLFQPEELERDAWKTMFRLDGGMERFIRTIREAGSLSGIAHLKGAIDLVNASLNESNLPSTNEYRIKLLDFFDDVDSLPYGKSIEPNHPIEITIKD